MRGPCAIERRSAIFRHDIPDGILTIIAADIADLAVADINVMICSAAVCFHTDAAALFVLIVIAPVAHAQVIDLPILLVAEIDGRPCFTERSVIVNGWRV